MSDRDGVPSSAGNSSAPALSVHRLSRRFGDRVAFQDGSFEIGHGEVFGFLGPNGAGKSTMVRTLGTLLSPTSGSATVAGIPLTPENGVEIRRRISIMPESPCPYLRLSVTENLECFVDLAPWSLSATKLSVSGHQLMAASGQMPMAANSGRPRSEVRLVTAAVRRRAR